MEGVGAVGLGLGGVVVDFEEDAVNAGSDGGAGETGMNSGWPPETPLAAEGVCTEWVASKTTGRRRA